MLTFFQALVFVELEQIRKRCKSQKSKESVFKLREIVDITENIINGSEIVEKNLYTSHGAHHHTNLFQVFLNLLFNQDFYFYFRKTRQCVLMTMNQGYFKNKFIRNVKCLKPNNVWQTRRSILEL